VFIAVWASVLALALWFSWQYAALLAGTAFAVGIIAGLLQTRALTETPERFQSAVTAIDVRRALVANASGKLSIILLWCNAVVSLLWALSANPNNPIFAWLAGFASFRLARESIALPAVLRLGQLK
jgi:hypothetical protein